MEKAGYRRLVKKVDMRGANIPRNAADMEYVTVTKEVAQCRKSRFPPARYWNSDMSPWPALSTSGSAPTREITLDGSDSR